MCKDVQGHRWRPVESFDDKLRRVLESRSMWSTTTRAGPRSSSQRPHASVRSSRPARSAVSRYSAPPNPRFEPTRHLGFCSESQAQLKRKDVMADEIPQALIRASYDPRIAHDQCGGPSNSPVGDCAEYLTAAAMGLAMNASSSSGCDAVGPHGNRYATKNRSLRSTCNGHAHLPRLG